MHGLYFVYLDVAAEKDGENVGSPVSQGHPSGNVRRQQAMTPCDMCSNYEAQLVRAQQRGRELEKQIATHERTIERYREDLTKESGFRKDIEDKWNEKKEEHKMQVNQNILLSPILTTIYTCTSLLLIVSVLLLQIISFSLTPSGRICKCPYLPWIK